MNVCMHVYCIRMLLYKVYLNKCMYYYMYVFMCKAELLQVIVIWAFSSYL